MEDILFLVHRIPYPPNKGDKIRSFNFLKALSQNFNVYLGTFIDDEHDWNYVEQLKEYCQEHLCLPLDPKQAKIKSLTGLVTGKALTLPYYSSEKMQEWVDKTLAENNIKKAMIYSSVMTKFIMHHPLEIISDFVDVDSDKWRQYSDKKMWLESWVYRRESKKLLEYEKIVASRSKVSVFVSDKEAELFQQLSPENQEKIIGVNNGVDYQEFDPGKQYSTPYSHDEKVIVFVGAMDYWANIDAVVWFSNEMFPLILNEHPQAKFYIVGSKPSKEVLQLGSRTNITVTGRVDDVKNYLHFACFAVAPLRIARGIQNKVLEAMSMEKQVIATSAAMEGIAGYENQDVFMTDDVEQFANYATQLLSSKQNNISSKNRLFVKENFSWHANTEKLIRLINS